MRFRVAGSSMMGAIYPGDLVEVQPVKAAQLQRGDIVVYECQGRLVAHRLVGILDQPGRELRFIVRGDNLGACDRPVFAHAVLGRVTAIERNVPALIRTLGRSVFTFFSSSKAGRPVINGTS